MAAAQARSWRRRRADQRSSVDAVNATATSTLAAEKATARFEWTIRRRRYPPGPPRAHRRLCACAQRRDTVSGVPQARRIPDATVARLPEYLRILVELTEQKLRTVSSGQLAGLAGVNAAKVRKDLSHLGTYGTRGV